MRGTLPGVHLVDEPVLAAMEAFADVAPAHNPPYTQAMRMLRDRFPRLPLVAAFETGFHRTIPEANQRYAIPDAWATELGIRRWGFHGASHRYIAGRMSELLGRADIKLISCHLGGSSSLCAIRHGCSVACSLGMSPQSGLPHNNRVGDFDVFRAAGLAPRDRQESGRDPGDPGQPVGTRRPERRGARPARHRGRRRGGQPAGRPGPRRVHRLDPPLPRCLSARAGRRRRHRLHRGDRRELIADSIRGLPRPRLVRSRARPRPQRFREGRTPGLDPRFRVQVWTVPTNEEIVVARQAKQLLDSIR